MNNKALSNMDNIYWIEPFDRDDARFTGLVNAGLLISVPIGPSVVVTDVRLEGDQGLRRWGVDIEIVGPDCPTLGLYALVKIDPPPVRTIRAIFAEAIAESNDD